MIIFVDMIILFSVILQVALGAITQHPNLSAGSLCGYYPQDTVYTAAPAGYKPFYISLTARHGSRYLSHGDSVTFRVADTLAMLAGKGMLAADGLALMEDIQMLRAIHQGNYGALTELGAQEHHEICARMYRHYPEVFSNKSRKEVSACSTPTMRVQKSMKAFTDELAGRAPWIEISKSVLGWEDYPVNRGLTGNYLDREARERAKAEEKNFTEAVSALRRGYGLETFAGRVFADPQTISSSRLKYIARACFKCLKTGCLTTPASMPAMDKYFTAGELYYLWLSGSMSWARYLNYPGYMDPFTRERGGGMIAQLIEDTDEALSPGSRTAATLRFSHDNYLMPLMAAVPFEGTVLDCPDTEIPEIFQDYNYIYPACNVQMIFYHRRCSKRILVKFLLNEKETLIHGLSPVSGCYYDWDRVRDFWKKRFDL